MMDQILRLTSKLYLWQFSLAISIALLFMGFTGDTAFTDAQVIEGKESLAIFVGVVFFVATCVLKYMPPPEAGPPSPIIETPNMDVVERILGHEGFESKPYQDSLSIWTIGHGLTWLSEEESAHIVRGRVRAYIDRLVEAHAWLASGPPDVVEVLVEMCFQLGWTGCHNFSRMWIALRRGEFKAAADEMLDSKWATQTPARALELSNIIRALA